jgi:hypothetical protein
MIPDDPSRPPPAKQSQSTPLKKVEVDAAALLLDFFRATKIEERAIFAVRNVLG